MREALERNDTLTPSEFEKYIKANTLVSPNPGDLRSAENHYKLNNSTHVMLQPHMREISSGAHGSQFDSIPDSGEVTKIRDSRAPSQQFFSLDHVHYNEPTSGREDGHIHVLDQRRISDQTSSRVERDSQRGGPPPRHPNIISDRGLIDSLSYREF